MSIRPPILAIDPATKLMGVAFFDGESWTRTKTLSSRGKDRQGRQQELLDQLDEFMTRLTEDYDLTGLVVVSEEPLLRGLSNNAMQRVLGALEAFFAGTYINYIHPKTVKAAMGSGDLDKLSVALAAGEFVESDPEKEMLAQLIKDEEWDCTDAIAIGLTWIIRRQQV